MRTIRVNVGKPYAVHIRRGQIADVGSRIAQQLPLAKRFLLVSDDNVYPLYGKKVSASLAQSGCQVSSYVFPHGEGSKTLATYGDLLQALCEARLSRDDCLVALGGGVAGDLAGFAAATYLRGIRFVQIPTTLLACVDSSVGGKTGLDLAGGKNQVGCFYQPDLVLCDPDTLLTLPAEEYRNGCAEVIKYALLGGESLFVSVRDTPVCEQYEEIIARCVEIKRDFVEKDEFDRGARMLLNLGHTVGHAVETCSGYTIPHGQAVAIGMAVITKAAVEKGLCERDTSRALSELLALYSLPTQCPFSADMLARAARADKKSTEEHMTLIVPERIGRCRALTIATDEIPIWLAAGGVR